MASFSVGYSLYWKSVTTWGMAWRLERRTERGSEKERQGRRERAGIPGGGLHVPKTEGQTCFFFCLTPENQCARRTRNREINQYEALTRHVVKAQLTRHTHTHALAYAHRQAPANKTHAHTTASGRHCCKPCPLCACSLCPLHSLLARQQADSLSSFYFWSNYHQVLQNRDEASYCLAKVSSSENVTGTPLVALAARRSRRVRTTGLQPQVNRLRSLPRRNLGTTGVSKDWDHVKARTERTPD